MFSRARSKQCFSAPLDHSDTLHCVRVCTTLSGRGAERRTEVKERDRQFLPATFTCPRMEPDRTSSYVASIQERPQRNTGLKERKKPGKLQTSRNVHFYSGGKERGFLPATLRCPTHQPTNPPTQIQELRHRHLSKTNSQLHPTICKQPKNQSTQTESVRNAAAPKRMPT